MMKQPLADKQLSCDLCGSTEAGESLFTTVFSLMNPYDNTGKFPKPVQLCKVHKKLPFDELTALFIKKFES